MEEKTMFSIREFFEELDKEGILLLLQDYMTDLRVLQQRYITYGFSDTFEICFCYS